MTANLWRGALYGITAASIWGGMYVVSDIVLEVIPPFALLTSRLVLAILSLGIWFLFSRPAIPNKREILPLILVGLLGYGVSVGAQFVGTDKSTAINGALITSASPAFILIFAAWILHEKLTWIRIASVALASLGVVVIIDPAKADFGSDAFLGNIALVIAALTWGLFSVLIRKVSEKQDTSIVTFFGFMGGLLLTIPATLFELPQRPIGEITPEIILGILYLGIISTAVAMWLWNRAFALVDASVASLFFFAQPFVGALLGVLVLNQELTINLQIGSVLIILGVLLSIVKRRDKKAILETSDVPTS